MENLMREQTHLANYLLSESMEILIPAGITEDQMMVVSNRGNIGRFGGPRGDIAIRIKVINPFIFFCPFAVY